MTNLKTTPKTRAIVTAAKPAARRAKELGAVEGVGGNVRPEAARKKVPKASPNPVIAKPKLVRDSFTIPKSEFTVLESLKLRAAKLARPTKKSEVLRAGIGALSVMSDKAFLAALGAVPSLKTGRPKGVTSVSSMK